MAGGGGGLAPQRLREYVRGCVRTRAPFEGGMPPLVAHPLRPGNVIFGVGESGTVVPLRTGAASAPGRPSHAGAGDAPHKVFVGGGVGGGGGGGGGRMVGGRRGRSLTDLAAVGSDGGHHRDGSGGAVPRAGPGKGELDGEQEDEGNEGVGTAAAAEDGEDGWRRRRTRTRTRTRSL